MRVRSRIGAAAVAAAIAGLPAAAPAASRPAGGVREIVVVFKTHFDIGYTDLARNVVQRYRTAMIDQALEIVDRNRALPPDERFVWTLPGWPMAQIAGDWPGQTADRLKRVGDALREGRFVVHALPFTTHTELLEPEDLVRGLGFSSRLARGTGVPLPRDAKMTDVPSHSWILPTLLRAAGVDFLHLGCNAASASPRVPALFWWEGPDGSRLLTMYSAAGYGTGLIPPVEWPYRTWLALIHTGDNQGPPKPEDIRALIDEAAGKLPGVKVRIGRLSDFADALLAEKPEIPVVRGDMPDTWIHGPMSDPAGSMLARTLRPAVGTAEALGTLLDGWSARPARAEDAARIARAYEKSLLYGEHTWGGALYWVTEYGAKLKWGYGDVWKADRAAGRFKKLDESWDEHRAYIEGARDEAGPLLAEELRSLARATAVDGRRVAVFNPLPWRRDGLVDADGLDPSIEALRPAEGGAAAPVARTATGGRFFARSVPALGYRVFVPAPLADAPAGIPPTAGPSAAGAVLESRWMRVTVDPGRLAIRSLVDKATGRELVDPASARGFGSYLYERFDADQVAAFRKAYVKIDADWGAAELGKPNLPPASRVPYRSASPAGGTLELERTPISAAAVLRATASPAIPHDVVTRVVLYADAPYLDLEMTLRGKPADPWPEAGWICLPFKIDGPRFRVGRPGSIVDPAADLIAGANRSLYAVNTGVAFYEESGRGAAFCAVDDPLISLDRPGAWTYAPDFVPRTPVAYIQLFNNQWTTNFRFWNEGTWTARVRIWTFGSYAAGEALTRPSLEARYPLRAALASGGGGALPASGRGVEVSTPGTLVTAFGPNPDGDGTVLRLWELAGRSGRCAVRLPEGSRAAAVRPVDLRGAAAGPAIPVKDGTFVFEARAFAPASFLIAR